MGLISTYQLVGHHTSLSPVSVHSYFPFLSPSVSPDLPSCSDAFVGEREELGEMVASTRNITTNKGPASGPGGRRGAVRADGGLAARRLPQI